MKSVILSNDYITNVGMRLAGIPGMVVRERPEMLRAFKTATEDETLGMIIVTEPVYHQLEDVITAHRLKKKLPLVVTIPPRVGERDKNFLIQSVTRSIGLKVE